MRRFRTAMQRIGLFFVLLACGSSAWTQAAQERISISGLPSALGLDAAAPGLLRAERNLVVERGLAPTRAPLPTELPLRNLHAEIRERLLPGEALLLYRQTDEALQGWLVARHLREPVAFRHPVAAAEVASAIAAWRQALLQPFDLAARAPALRGMAAPRTLRAAAGPSADAAASRLAAWLLPRLPGGWEPIQHLTIVPTGSGALVPWPALPVGDGELLVDKVSVSLAPSLGQFLQLPRADAQDRLSHALRREVSPDGRSAMVLQRLPADPALAYSVDSAVVVGDPAYADDPQWQFPALPGAAREARQVGALVRQPVLAGAAATKDAVLQAVRARQKTDLLYLATHAVASASDPLEGGFVALAGAKGQAAQASRWTAREIQSERLLADLVVLSACQTGLGGVHEAGIIGVGRAFYLAGVPQVLVSLWSVDDSATADLMGHFTRRLTGAFRFFPADAVRAAMLLARQRRPEPVYWASFTVFGIPNVVWTH